MPTNESEQSGKIFRWLRFSRENLSKFAKLCTLDLYVFLICFGFAITRITGLQLIQDKVCLNQLKLPANICYNIEKRPGYEKEAIKLYKAATTFRTNENIIVFIPSILITLFSGRLLDKYPGQMKFFLAAPGFGIILHSILMIYHVIHFEIDYRQMYWVKLTYGLTGNMALFYSASYTYVLRYNPKNLRQVRFGMVDFAMHIGFASCISAGGTILVSNPWFYSGLRNYLGVYATSAIVNLIALIWIFLFMRTSNSGEDQSGLDKNENCCPQEQASSTDLIPDQSPSSNNDKLLVRFVKNIAQMVKTFTKKRENDDHIRLWWSLVCFSISQICIMSELIVVFQFAQRVYGWDAQYFSNLRAVTELIPTFGAALFPMILINKLKLSDTTLGIIGSYSLIFAYLIKGGFLVPSAFYVGEIVSMFIEMTPIAFRTIASRLITSDEYGQVSTVLSIIQSSSRLLSTIISTAIFNRTLHAYPGTVYLLATGVMFIPYLVLLWMDLTQRRINKRQAVSQ
ncbi:uncharacterized protein LOC141854362 [Brevipalpus obovatus]|uniref:uncharacterized protein LOC141854362 n=1 Tax=Brevipalpus obovatus TaxID=246614 RepID=UPI003D9DF849